MFQIKLLLFKTCTFEMEPKNQSYICTACLFLPNCYCQIRSWLLLPFLNCDFLFLSILGTAYFKIFNIVHNVDNFNVDNFSTLCHK